jgi:3-methylcrotonyl-CoA carboxylase alpha subunit
MFQKILIANRGEIACRIIETARRLGIATVAVYSDSDRQARHCELADEAVAIGAAPARDSYLAGERIIAAALGTGAEAIHPGYGFLSENPDFVDAATAAGLVFIGPSAASIRAMGLKDAAKARMSEAGVPVVPGYHGGRQEADLLADEAARIGYPIMIKARAGGGGKGMRLVEDPASFAEALAGAQREGLASFGDPAVLIEKYIASPRHIEVQVFGDRFGNFVHLFERDCSLQRRHQKVIEEAPAPEMPPDVREAMTDAALRAAQAVGYVNAGTVEFIADGSGPLRADGFWFMEMNTRLQVEHPVTEAVTGLDLVEWQLRIAAGQPLPRSQNQIALNGHAFEARIYAEDPARDFRPAPGHLRHVAFPAGVRVDTGIRSGDLISPHYDPMIAKLITHAPTRHEALTRMRLALEQIHIAGTAANPGFLAALCRDPDFAEARVDTGLIARKQSRLTRVSAPTPVAILAAVLVSYGLDPTAAHFGLRLWGADSQIFELIHDNAPISARLCFAGAGRITLVDGDDRLTFEDLRLTDDQFYARCNGRNIQARIVHMDDLVSVLINGITSNFRRPDPLTVERTGEVSGNRIIAPMTGVIRALSVAQGDAVATGDVLVVIEAMKMELSLRAAKNGVLASLHCAVGDTVADGALLAELGLIEEVAQ